jgi:Fur family ferric uptake transcriptional regulator/Fur family zinc uptake transcriptional regulator
MEPKAKLERAGLRRTRIRELVLQILHGAGRPLTHQEIGARPRARGLDRVTLYRTLSTLQAAGLVHGIRGVDGFYRSAGHAPDQPRCPGNHAHFLCLRCGGMQCLPGQAMPRISIPRGNKVLGKQLVVFGQCRTCAAKKGRK